MSSECELEEMECCLPSSSVNSIEYIIPNDREPNNNEIPGKNQIDDIWEYYDKNKDFLLRFCLIKNPDYEELIRFEVLNTKNISERYEMFSEFFKRKTLVEDLDIKNKKIDVFTYILLLFDTNPPEGEFNEINNEFILIIAKNKNKKNKYRLKNRICEDDNFFKKNITKKFNELEKNLEKVCSNFEEENTQINKKNDELEKELNLIIEENNNLEKNITYITKSLNELEKNQEKVINILSNL